MCQKGEECKQELQQFNITAKIKILELNMDDYKSVQSFATALQREVSVVDILILNAGIGLLKFERSPSGHERVTQVNYLSNVLLITALVPHLKESAEKTGRPVRVTWVGSRMYFDTSLDKKAPLKAGESVLEHMDSKEFFLANQRYNDSKLLCAMFMYSLAPRLDKSKIVLTMVCPGLVNTNMTDVLPLHVRMVMGVVKTLFARPVEVGGRLFIHAAVVAGPESHGRFLGDKDIIEYGFCPVTLSCRLKRTFDD
ncbi:retinol dehydrogenase 14 [Aspergillus udagawae]|nr:retinol dehydrogenase 14 [Aspergillus udagawae]GFF34260.1 retinol dehydrogenase 14 [Aspergillus udagawae]GFG17641.1 retinol dehydrogenase 14 [Aspergillus udagawae]